MLRMNEIIKLTNVEGEEINKAKKTAAFEITKLVHGEEEAKKAQTASEAAQAKAEAAQKAGYTDIFKKSLIGITEMERLMGKKKFNEILGSLVYKPDGKVTLVPDSDKREAVKTATAEADFKED